MPTQKTKKCIQNPDPKSISQKLCINKRKVMKAVIESQFGYCFYFQ